MSILNGVEAIVHMHKNKIIMRNGDSKKFYRLYKNKLEYSRTGNEDTWEPSIETLTSFLDCSYSLIQQ